MFSNLKILGMLIFVCFEMIYSCILIVVQSRWLKMGRGRGGQRCSWRAPPAPVFPLQNQRGKKADFLAEKYTGGFLKAKKISVSAVENWSWDRTDNVLLCEKLEPGRRWQLTYLVQPCAEAVASPGAQEGQGRAAGPRGPCPGRLPYKKSSVSSVISGGV